MVVSPVLSLVAETEKPAALVNEANTHSPVMHLQSGRSLDSYLSRLERPSWTRKTAAAPGRPLVLVIPLVLLVWALRSLLVNAIGSKGMTEDGLESALVSILMAKPGDSGSWMLSPMAVA